jgi:hypothetical protein
MTAADYGDGIVGGEVGEELSIRGAQVVAVHYEDESFACFGAHFGGSVRVVVEEKRGRGCRETTHRWSGVIRRL